MSDETILIDPPQDTCGAMVRLRVVKGPHANMSWTVSHGTTLTIGRQSPAQIRLPQEPAFSREHLRLVIKSPYAELSDLGSSNGSFVNGLRVVSATLTDGDCFGVGETEIAFELVSEAAASAVPPPALQNPIPQGPIQSREGQSREAPVREIAPTEVLPVGKSLAKVDIAETLIGQGAATQVASSRPNRTVGAYEILGQLGEGGMATVFHAKHRGSGEEVAIKLIRASQGASEKMIQLFAREASILSKMNHPRIVRCLEFGFHEQQPFLVMELIKTVDLLKLLSTQQAEIRLKTSCWITSRILQALAYAHEQKFVHRDVKPGNILAYREQHRLQVKLSDFGLAKCYEHAGFSAMTDEVSMRGTIAYMSPEQVRSSKTAGPPADIFSAGACLYRMLLGQMPPVAAMGGRVATSDITAAGFPESVARVIVKSMNSDPAKRFASATEMEAALKPFHGKP